MTLETPNGIICVAVTGHDGVESVCSGAGGDDARPESHQPHSQKYDLSLIIGRHHPICQ